MANGPRGRRFVPKTRGETSPFAELGLEELNIGETLNPSFVDWDGDARPLAGSVGFNGSVAPLNVMLRP